MTWIDFMYLFFALSISDALFIYFFHDNKYKSINVLVVMKHGNFYVF